jgi:hypothetical protein
LKLYAGFDEREEAGYHAFTSSVVRNSSIPVSITPLSEKSLSKFYDAGQRDGTNAFTYSRFLIPYLEDFEGWAVFADGCDMVCREDLAELEKIRDPWKAVQFVHHDYKTKHSRKYIGEAMEADNGDYPRKNCSSLMIINCSHYAWRDLTPEQVAKLPGSYLHRFQFIPERYIGKLPVEWNWLVDEYGENEDAKLLHWTAGIPAFEHYKDAPMAAEWFKYAR